MNLADLFADEDYRFQMGMRRGSPAEFFQPTAQHDAIVAERQRWLRSEPEKYSALLPEGVAPLEECLSLARAWGTISSNAACGGCVQLGETWEPDFLMLKPDAAGKFQLVGGCLCFPSSWSLAEKIGRPLEFIHGPVPGLNAQLGRSIDSFLSRLTPGVAWLRHNWGLSRSPELNQHPSRALPRLDDSVSLAEVWLRVEQQALVALPQSRGVLFGIRVTSHALAEVKRDVTATERLARALRTMPEPMAAYKGIAPARARIMALLGG